MKKYLALLLFLACASLSAQLTTVSGTVIDSDGTTWANGTWQMQFVPAPGQSNLNVYTLGGVSITSPTYVQYLNQSGSLSGSGTFSFSSLDNSRITPVGSQLKVTFCPQATSLCGSVTLPVSGPTITIGAPTITAAIQAPRFQGVAGSYGYADVEAQVQTVPGSTYYNVAVGCQKYYNPLTTSWSCYASSGTLITPPADIQTAVNNGGPNFDLWLSCGTFNVPSGLIINNPGVHFHGQSKECTNINFTSSVGLTINSVAGFSEERIHWQGATNNWTVKIGTASPVTRFTDSIISGAGSFVGAASNTAALWVQSPNSDITVDHVEFTGNGVTGNGGYVVRTDGFGSGYVSKFHFVYNWIHDNISPDALYGFDLGDGSDLSNNTIDQGNICGGTLCNNPAGNGIGYSIMAYSQAYGCDTLAGQFTCNVLLTRTGNVVTAVMGGFLPSWPLHIGDTMFVETAQYGLNGTDFNGLFPITAFGTGLTGGTGYTTANGLGTSGGSGTGATVNVTATAGVISTVAIASGGAGYTFGDKITIIQGGGSGGYAIVAKVTGGVINALANYGMTWSQTAPDDTDDHIPGDAGLTIPPMQNIKIQSNYVTNSSGACIYIQGLANSNINGNVLIQCDLQSQAGGHPQSAIGLNGIWGGTVSVNSINHVGLTHGIGVDNAYFTTVTGNNITDIPQGYGVQLFDSFHLTVGDNVIDKAVRGGIGGITNTNPNCLECSFPGNTIRMASNGSAYDFSGADRDISITGGSIHAPENGLSNSAIGLGPLTSNITVSGVTINCQPDGATSATATLVYGIRSSAGASKNLIKGNSITGCLQGAGAGIVDFGDDDVLDGNKITNSHYGILGSTGNRPLVTNNIVWGNVTPINVTSAGAFLSGNQTSQTGGVGNYNVSAGYLINGNLILPSFLTGYQGSSGTKVALTDGNPFTSGNLRKTVGDGSESDVPNLISNEVPRRVIDCGPVAACGNSIPVNPWYTFGGPLAMAAGTVTITGITPAYTSNASYRCMTWDISAPANATTCNRVSGSSITITGTGTDTVQYLLIGN